MKINLKEDIWIVGFDDSAKRYDFLLSIGGRKNTIYDGKTSEIPEEIAEKCVYSLFGNKESCRDYSKSGVGYESYPFTAKESIQSACDKKWCIIYKKNT